VLWLPAHPRSCESVEELSALARSIQAPLAADLFCGAGGLSLGLADAGFEVILGVDHDRDALATHRANHPGLSIDWDLGDPDVVERVAQIVRENSIMLVAGGPPCQPFSKAGRSIIHHYVKAGKRDLHDRRRDLWESFLGVVELGRPRAVLMENVPDMALDRGMVILRTMIERLEGIGYSVEPRIVETWRYGVPQFRQRLILIALADEISFKWPQESEIKVTVENAIGDLPSVEGGWRPSNGDGIDPAASGWCEYLGPKTSFQARARERISPESSARVYDQITRPVRADDAIAFSQMTHETRYSDLDPSLKRYRDDIFDDKYKRLNPHDVSRTITAHIAKDGYWYIHPHQDRTITVREAARLQTFRDDIRFSGPPSAAFRQIGNAVPVILGEHLGTAILDSLNENVRAQVSTGRTAKKLALWFRDQPSLGMPWLRAENRWQAIQGEYVLARMGHDKVTLCWAALSKNKTPQSTLNSAKGLEKLGDMVGRREKIDKLIEMAKWFEAHPELLGTSSTASEMSAAPHLSLPIASMACRIVPGETEDPVIGAATIQRVSSRYFGHVDGAGRKQTNVRLAIAKMISLDDDAHDAHLALFEIADRVCTSSSPSCHECPLEDTCAFASSRPKQARFELTTQETSQPEGR